MANEIAIRLMIPEDWETVLSIYLEGLATGDATFETEAPSWEQWDESHLGVPRLVAVAPSEGVVAWAALARVSSRAVYLAGFDTQHLLVKADALLHAADIQSKMCF